MALMLVVGAVALDRPILLDGALSPGGRLRARSLDGALGGRLGGGASNSGSALVQAGHKVMVATSLADDAEGEEVRALAEAAGLDLSLLRLRPGPTSRTLIFLDPFGERTIISLDGAAIRSRPAIPSPAEHPETRPDALFIRGAYEGAADWARATRGPVMLHWPSPLYQGEADVIVASADDLPAELAAAPFVPASARLGPRLRWVVVTHGKDGAVAHGAEGRIAVPAERRTVRDATGAGDVFAAGLLDALAAGAEMEAALRHACAWGGAAVELEGSAPTGAAPGTFRAYRP